jgi:hypothetical protein
MSKKNEITNFVVCIGRDKVQWVVASMTITTTESIYIHKLIIRIIGFDMKLTNIVAKAYHSFKN